MYTRLVVKKLAYIDSMRGLAVLGVLMVHTNQYGQSLVSGMPGKIISEAASGVQLFFLTSAFTLFLSFRNRSATEAAPIRNFFIRRFFRIAPVYYLGVCYYLFQDGLAPRYWLGDAPGITPANIASNFLFLHGFNPYWVTSIVPGGWSIGVEMTFYLLVPVLFLKLKSLDQAFLFFIASVVLSVVLQLVLTRHPPIPSVPLWNAYLYFYFPSQLPIFSLGIVLYFVIAENETVKNISGMTLLAFGGLWLAQAATETQFIFPSHVLFGFGYLVLGIALSKTNVGLIVNPVLNHIGKISFSMYLVHFAVLHWLERAGFIDYARNSLLNYGIKFSVVCLLTASIATGLYRLLEVPGQNLGKALIANLEQRPVRTIKTGA